MQADEVRGGEEFVERHGPHARLADRAAAAAVHQDVHAEAARLGHHQRTDGAVADQAERAAAEVAAGEPGPLPRPHRRVGLRDPPGGGQQQPEGVLGHRRGVQTRQRVDPHAELGRRRGVDVVEPGADPQHVAQLGRGLQEPAVDRLEADDQAVDLPQHRVPAVAVTAERVVTGQVEDDLDAEFAQPAHRRLARGDDPGEQRDPYRHGAFGGTVGSLMVPLTPGIVKSTACFFTAAISASVSCGTSALE